MHQFITEHTQLLEQYGYALLALSIFLEGMCIPAPGQSLLLVASLLAAKGSMNINIVIVVAGISGFLGNLCGFLLGKKFGHIVLARKWIKPKTQKKLHGFIQRYGIAAILFSRFLEGLKQCMPMACGIAEMSPARFMLGNFIAVGIWVLCFTLAPLYLVDEVEPMLAFYHHHQAFLFTALVLLLMVLALLIFRYIRR